MEILLNPEEKIMCPYNSSHHISRKRMNTHLVKCKKSYPDSKLVECDFNVNHKIPEPELQYHHENCPNRRNIEITIYKESGTEINKFPVHNVHVPTEDSWDDFNVPSYDPKKYCESKDVLRHLDVESAAKRRNFRISERKRISQITNIQDNRPLQEANARNTYASSTRDLPETQRTVLDEDTPDSIAEIMQRIKIGANKCFVGKSH